MCQPGSRNLETGRRTAYVPDDSKKVRVCGSAALAVDGDTGPDVNAGKGGKVGKLRGAVQGVVEKITGGKGKKQPGSKNLEVVKGAEVPDEVVGGARRSGTSGVIEAEFEEVPAVAPARIGGGQGPLQIPAESGPKMDPYASEKEAFRRQVGSLSQRVHVLDAEGSPAVKGIRESLGLFDAAMRAEPFSPGDVRDLLDLIETEVKTAENALQKKREEGKRWEKISEDMSTLAYFLKRLGTVKAHPKLASDAESFNREHDAFMLAAAEQHLEQAETHAIALREAMRILGPVLDRIEKEVGEMEAAKKAPQPATEVSVDGLTDAQRAALDAQQKRMGTLSPDRQRQLEQEAAARKGAEEAKLRRQQLSAEEAARKAGGVKPGVTSGPASRPATATSRPEAGRPSVPEGVRQEVKNRVLEVLQDRRNAFQPRNPEYQGLPASRIAHELNRLGAGLRHPGLDSLRGMSPISISEYVRTVVRSLLNLLPDLEKNVPDWMKKM